MMLVKIKNGKLGHILATETTRMIPKQSCVQPLSMVIKAAGLRMCFSLCKRKLRTEGPASSSGAKLAKAVADVNTRWRHSTLELW